MPPCSAHCASAAFLLCPAELSNPSRFPAAGLATTMKGVSMRARLLLAVLAMVLLLGLSVPASAGPVKLTYANFPPAVTFPCVQMERWKVEVEKRTDGAVRIETFAGGTLLGAKNMFDGVKQGIADIGNLCMSYQPGVFPLTTALELPVGFSSSEVGSLVLWDIYEKYQPAAFKDVKVLAMFTTAPTNIMSRQPVRNLADMVGLEIRAAGGASRVMELLGAVPVSMPMSETPEALQKGLVKGLFSSMEVLKDFNFAELCRYESVTNFQMYPFAVVMNQDSWNGLPDNVKKVMDDLRREQSQWTGNYMDGHVEESLAWSKEKYNIEVIQWDASELAAANKLLQPLTDGWLKRAAEAGVPAQQVFDDMMALKAKYEKELGK